MRKQEGTFYTKIEELQEFKKGDTFKKIEVLADNIYLYGRYDENGLTAYEVVKGVTHKNPDGEMIKMYPTSSLWGTYGLFFPKWMTREQMLERVNAEWATDLK